jgi:hypothetical protein
MNQYNDNQNNDNQKLKMDLSDKITRILLFSILSFFMIKFISNNSDYDIMIIVLAITLVFVFINLFYPIVILK